MASPSSPITVPRSTTIFPNSDDDVETHIIDFSETTDLIPLSRVNKAAQDKLKNEEIFKTRFFIEHPLLMKCPRIFRRVHENHPNSSWKLGYSAMRTDNFQVSLSFIKNSTESIAVALNNAKEALEIYHTGLCGSRFADPASPIHKAWEAMQRGVQELQEIHSKRQQLLQDLQQTYVSPEEAHGALFFLTMDPSIVDLLRDGAEEVISITYFDASRQKNVTTRFYKGILPLYAKSVQLDAATRIQRHVISERTKCFQEMKKQESTYAQALSDVKSQLLQIDQWTKSQDKNSHHDFFSQIRDKLYQQFAMAKQLEENIKCLPTLEECRDLINTLREQNAPPLQADLDRVRELINSCPLKIMTSFWLDLYLQCAQGVHEDRWSENHFAEHLHMLSVFVKTKIIEIQDQQKQFE